MSLFLLSYNNTNLGYYSRKNSVLDIVCRYPKTASVMSAGIALLGYGLIAHKMNKPGYPNISDDQLVAQAQRVVNQMNLSYKPFLDELAKEDPSHLFDRLMESVREDRATDYFPYLSLYADIDHDCDVLYSLFYEMCIREAQDATKIDTFRNYISACGQLRSKLYILQAYIDRSKKMNDERFIRFNIYFFGTVIGAPIAVISTALLLDW